MEKERKRKIAPIIKPSFDIDGPLRAKFTIKNRGEGYANEVRARWGFIGAENSHEWNCHTMNSGEDHWFYLSDPEDMDQKLTNIDQIQELVDDGFDTVWFEAECLDADDREHHFTEEINLEENVLQRFNSENNTAEMFDKNYHKKIYDELDDLSDELHKIRKKMAFKELKSHLKQSNTSAVLEFLSDTEKTTMNEIAKSTGVGGMQLRNVITNLDDIDFIDVDGEIMTYLTHNENPEIILNNTDGNPEKLLEEN
jgi:hypothetical protein